MGSIPECSLAPVPQQIESPLAERSRSRSVSNGESHDPTSVPFDFAQGTATDFAQETATDFALRTATDFALGTATDFALGTATDFALGTATDFA